MPLLLWRPSCPRWPRTDVRSPQRVLVIPPCWWSSLFQFLGLLLRLLEPVGDLVPFLLPGRFSDLRDEGVLVGVCCASTSDLSVMSSILGAVFSVGWPRRIRKIYQLGLAIACLRRRTGRMLCVVSAAWLRLGGSLPPLTGVRCFASVSGMACRMQRIT